MPLAWGLPVVIPTLDLQLEVLESTEDTEALDAKIPSWEAWGLEFDPATTHMSVHGNWQPSNTPLVIGRTTIKVERWVRERIHHMALHVANPGLIF